MDQAVFHLINEQWTSPFMDLFMAAVSDVEIWKPLFILLVLYALIFGGFKGRAFIICLAITLLITDTLVARALKSSVGRLRPKQAQTVRMVTLQKTHPKFLTLFKEPRIRHEHSLNASGGPYPSGHSFPSGHVTDNFAIAICLTFFFRRWGWLYFIVAAVISYSRVYLGAHWPSDVLGSALLVTGETLLILTALGFCWRRFAPRWAPDLFSRHPRLFGDPA